MANKALLAGPALLGLLLLSAVTDAHVPLQKSTAKGHSPPPEETGKIGHPLLCTPLAPSSQPPSSVHSLQPSDVALVAALGLSHSSHTAHMFHQMTEILTLFNPDLSIVLPNTRLLQNSDLQAEADDLVLSLQRSEALRSTPSWKLLVVFVSLDDVQIAPEEEAVAVSSFTKEVEKTLMFLQEKLHHTLVRVVVRSEDENDNDSCKSEDFHRTAILAAALQESLSEIFADNQQLTNRGDFTAMLLTTPIMTSDPPSHAPSHTASLPALRLWADMLQPMAGQPALDVHDDVTRLSCPTERAPFLRTYENSPSRSAAVKHTDSVRDINPIYGSELPCVDRSPSPSTPTSVHTLRPADIKVVAAMGDSLTAANGVGSPPNNLLDVMTEYRGLSWCIGGDGNLSTVTTLPNILREFNPSLVGYAVGKGGENSPKAFLNQAVPGANAHDMPEQARTLIRRMKNDSRIDFENDWKVITLFIGGNDLCDYCSDSTFYSPINIVNRLQEALDILHHEVPRALVNLVEVMYIVPLRKLHQDKTNKCPTFLMNLLCRCVVKPKENSQELQSLEDLNRAYQRGMRELVDSGRYDSHGNFTVVLQPFFRDVVLPLLEDGRPDRSYFSPDCFHLSQKAHSLMARALWNNMMEPLGNKTGEYDFSQDISLQCPSESAPYLRTSKNSNYTYPGPVRPPPPVTNWGSDFSCVDTAPSPTVPSSAHRLRPGDIKVVASLGDSITAGFGARAKNIVQLSTEERGVSWSIGGDDTLETVTTLPNILKKFNPNVYGFSKGTKKRSNGFNMAISGAKAGGIPGQVRSLISAWRNDTKVNWDADWKLVTLFIGGNDLCQYCHDRSSLSTLNYIKYLRESLDMLYNEVPRVLVNVAEILEIEDLRKISRNTIGCQFLQPNLCPCFLIPVENSPELTEMKRINRELQEGTEALVRGGRYDGREDFAVVLQPFFQNSVVPMNNAGEPEVDFFSADCFHFSERGHAEMAIALWNNMLEPVGYKQAYNNFTHDRSKIRCPTMANPFIFTRMNSAPPPPPTTTPSPAFTTPEFILCHEGVPAWAAAVLAIVGLLLGWGVTWAVFTCRGRHGTKAKSLEMEKVSQF